MKAGLIATLLLASMAGNAMLYRVLSQSNRPRPAESAGVEATADAPVAAEPSSSWPQPLPWTEFSGRAPAELASRLRGQGLPPRIARAVIIAQVSAPFDERRRALMERAENPYWSEHFMGNLTGDANLRALSRERAAALRAALGEETLLAGPTPAEIAAIQRLYGPIPPGKVLRLQEIERDYNDLLISVRQEAGPLMLAEDRAKLALLETEKQKDIQTLLTPEELEGYQVRHSQAANQLRAQLQWIDVSEEEFRALHRLQQSFNERYGASNALPAAMSPFAAPRQAAEQALVAEAKALLGAERGAEFERSRDPIYREVISFVTRLEKPRETAVQVLTLQNDIRQRANVISTPNVSPNERRRRLEQLVIEANAALTPLLGEEGTAAYRESSAGIWLRSLQQMATPH